MTPRDIDSRIAAMEGMLLSLARAGNTPFPADAATAIHLAFTLVGNLLVDVNRIAFALEHIAQEEKRGGK